MSRSCINSNRLVVCMIPIGGDRVSCGRSIVTWGSDCGGKSFVTVTVWANHFAPVIDSRLVVTAVMAEVVIDPSTLCNLAFFFFPMPAPFFFP